MRYERLRLAIEGHLAHITLDNAAAGNRIDARLLRELGEAASTVASTPAVSVLLLDAAGADFCLGWTDDLREHLLREPVLDPFSPIASLACATVAVIQGHAAGAGLELALACDIRVAASDARFAMPEVSSGILPLAGATQRLPRIAGKAASMDILLLGEEYDAVQALRCGLVSKVAADSESEGRALTEAIAARGPLAVRYAKEAASRGVEMSLEQGLRYEADLSVLLQTTDDRAEGLRAFFEKRPPNFTGS